MASAPRRYRPSRKDDILLTFAQMVAERGYDSVSIRDIAESMGISKGTVLHHYQSKDRILEQVHANYMQRRLREAELIFEELRSPTARLAGLVHQNLYAMRHDHAATVAFAREIARFTSDDVMLDVREMRRRYERLMRDVLASGMESGEFRPEDPRMLSLQVFGMFNWSWTWLRPEGEWTIEELGAAFMRTILSGIHADGSVPSNADYADAARVARSAISRVAGEEEDQR